MKRRIKQISTHQDAVEELVYKEPQEADDEVQDVVQDLKVGQDSLDALVQKTAVAQEA